MGFLKKVCWRRFWVTMLGLTITSILIFYRSFSAFFDWAKLLEDWLIILGYVGILAGYMFIINIWYRRKCGDNPEMTFRQVLLGYVLPVTVLITIFNTIYLQILVINEIPNILKYWPYWLEDFPYFLVPILTYVLCVHYCPKIRMWPVKEVDTQDSKLAQMWSTTRDPSVLMEYLHDVHGAEDRGDPLTARWMDMVLFYHQTNGYLVYLRNGEKIVTGMGRADFLESVVGPWFVEIKRAVYINMLYVDRDTWKEKDLKLHCVGAKALSLSIIEQIEQQLNVSRRGVDNVEEFIEFRLNAGTDGWDERVHLNGEN